MNAYKIDMNIADLKLTDELERQLVDPEFAALADTGTQYIDRIGLRLLAVTGLLVLAVMMVSKFL